MNLFDDFKKISQNSRFSLRGSKFLFKIFKHLKLRTKFQILPFTPKAQPLLASDEQYSSTEVKNYASENGLNTHPL